MLKTPRHRQITIIRLVIGRVPFIVYALTADKPLYLSQRTQIILESPSTGNAVIGTYKNFPLFPSARCILLVKHFRKNTHKGENMYEPTQEIIVAELRLRGIIHVAEIMRILGPGFASIIPYEIHRMRENGLVVYDEPLKQDSVLRLP